MADTTVTLVDAGGFPLLLNALVLGGGKVAIYHAEEAAQRLALMNALAALATHTDAQSILTQLQALATHADLATVIDALHGALTVNGLPTSLGQHVSAQSLAVALASDPDFRPLAGAITAVDTLVASAVGHANVPILTGAPTANSFVDWSLNGHSSASLSIQGTFTGTLQIEASGDLGASYSPAGGKVLGAAVVTSQISGKATVRVDVTGMTNIRVRAVQWTSGTATVKLSASAAPGLSQILNQVSMQPNYGPSNVSPLISTFTNAGGASGPFTPLAGRAINVELQIGTGTFGGAQIQLERSLDGGSSYVACTVGGQSLAVYTGPVSEQAAIESEVGVLYRLNPIVPPSAGNTIKYRMSQ